MGESVVEEKAHRPLWYTRHQGATAGPYPSSGIRRFLLLGRLSLDDQVSVDGDHWVPLRSVPEVIPPDVREAVERGDSDAVLPARLREDERTGKDRRDRVGGGAAQPDRRRRAERRRAESALEKRHRAARTALQEQLLRPRKLPLPGLLIAGLLVLSGIGTGLYLGAPEGPPDPDCSQPPSPQAIWRNCILDGLVADDADLRGADISSAVLRNARLSGSRLDGSDLKYSDLSGADLSYATLQQAQLKGVRLNGADLSYADLSNADLSFADLRGANIGGADLRGARFDQAIWIDGRSCAAGSVGGCAPK